MSMTNPPPGAIVAPAASRNSGPILAVLKAHLPARARVLEIAAGTGEHAIVFARALPGVDWTPSDPSAAARDSISAWTAADGPQNLRPPQPVDVLDPGGWPAGTYDAVVCINMIHIAPWEATAGLMDLGARVLERGGLLVLYGPYREAEVPLAPSNSDFDAGLKARDPAWGLRDREAVVEAARTRGLALVLRIPMPANNLMLLFRRV